MITFICNKLARDKTLETMEKTGITTTHRLLNTKEFLVALQQKLIEEAQEIIEAHDRKNIIQEIADVFEVIDAFKKVYKITNEEIIMAKEEIYQERGGFDNKIFLEKISMEDNNSRVKHFRASPERYKEE